MLPKRKRINKKDFQIILKKGNTISSHLFVFRFLYQKEPQYSFVVSKNIYKKAKDRNKLRRQGYNILRSLSIKTGTGLFFYKKETKMATQEEVKENIIFLLKKTKILY